LTKKLNPSEKSVLKALLENPFKLSTTRVAKDANISWNTAEKYLKQFQEKGWVSHRKRGQKKGKDIWSPIL
jgi:predicted transcriptional regulator